MPVAIITQYELADVLTLRESKKALDAQVSDIKARLAQGARTEHGRLRPRLQTKSQTYITERALRDILGASAFSVLKAKLPLKEIQALFIDQL